MAYSRRNVGGIKFEDVQSFGPIGTHKATIVWLHDIGETSANSVRFARQLGLRNIKWICPTAPRRPVTILGGMETNAWFDIAKISENMQDDEVSLHHAALSIANLFSDHASPNIMIGVGGMGMGAAQALYLASKSCYDTNQRLQIKPRVVLGLKGWLPGWRSLQNNVASNPWAPNRPQPQSTPILLTHSTDVVPYEFVHKCAHSLLMTGFQIMLKKYQGETNWNEVAEWLRRYLGL